MAAFHRLAQIEIQLIAHFLADARDILSLARCFRLALAACSQPFAWVHSNPIGFRYDANRLNLGERIAATPLLQHAAVAVEWLNAHSAPLELSEIEYLMSIPRVVSLDARRWIPTQPSHGFVLKPQHWLRLLSSSSLRGLRSLYLGDCSHRCPIDAAVLECISERFSDSLTTFHLSWDGSIVEDGFYAGFFSAGSMSALTDLNLTDVGERDWWWQEGARDVPVHQPQLRRLELRSFASRKVGCILFAETMARLRHLTLDRIRCDADPRAAVDWSACFARLRKLQSMTLRCCWSIDELLRHAAARCKSLRSLSIFVPLQPALAQQGSVAPSAAVLLHVLESRPLLSYVSVHVDRLCASDAACVALLDLQPRFSDRLRVFVE